MERVDLQKERNMLKASLSDKARVEAELRAQLSSLKKSAEESSANANTQVASSAAAAAVVEMLNEANAEVGGLAALFTYVIVQSKHGSVG